VYKRLLDLSVIPLVSETTLTIVQRSFTWNRYFLVRHSFLRRIDISSYDDDDDDDIVAESVVLTSEDNYDSWIEMTKTFALGYKV
jgi:hypothetical protein